jgi:crotonobetainyl-CoA:carnitine CoA-transferase CaiB-like acyl-CoA transferase
MSAKALAGIRVLDLSRILAGPTAAQLLGDAGAEVIKVERPPKGDDARRMGGLPLKDKATGKALDMSPMYLCSNRNKRSVAIDIAKPEGQELVRKLAVKADVVIENYKTGDLKRYGLDYESLKKINKRLVYCSITGFGQTGPYASRTGFDAIFQAMCGIMSVTGHPDGVPGGGPMRIGVPITDFICGVYAYGAITTALFHRERVSGEGQYIDLALLDSAISAMTIVAVNYLGSGVNGRRAGVESPTTVPSQLFACADGQVQISAPNDDIFRRLCKVLARPDIADDPRFGSTLDRVNNRAVLVPMLAQEFAKRQKLELTEAMEVNNVPCAPIYTMEDVFADPQVKLRGNSVEVPHPVTGTMRFGTNPIHFSATPITDYAPPPLIGEHTDEILRGELGLGDTQIAALREAKIV